MGMQSSNYAQLKTLNKKKYFLIPINFVLSGEMLPSSHQVPRLKKSLFLRLQIHVK